MTRLGRHDLMVSVEFRAIKPDGDEKMITPSRHTQAVFDWYETNWKTCRTPWVASMMLHISSWPAEEVHWEAMHIIAMESND